MNANIVLDPPLEVDSGTSVADICDIQPIPVVSDDGAPLNLPRSVAPDKQKKAAILKTKKTTNISTFNLRTGRENWRIHELIHHMDKHNISIIAIQEHRRVHPETIKYEHIDNHLLVTASAWRNSAQAAVGGVGFVINAAAEKSLCEVVRISARIVKASFSGNPESTFFSVYSPTNIKHNQTEADEFYQHIHQAIEDTPPHNFMALLGDWNAKVSSAHVKHAHDKRTNENGMKLLDLACEKSLCITNTMFEKRIGKRWSFEDPKGKQYLLDYILVNSKWKNSILNSEAYSTFASVGSDHRIITARIRLSLRSTKPASNKKRYDWSLLRHDGDLQSRFRVELRNRYSALYAEDSNISEQYGALVQANEHAAEATLPLVKRSKQERFANNPNIIEARKRVEKLNHSYKIQKSSVTRKHLAAAKQRLNEEYNRLEGDCLKIQIEEAELAFHANNTAKAWKIVNTITNRKSTPTGKLKDKSPEERKNQWYKHFNSLLGTADQCPPFGEIDTILHNVIIPDSAFSLAEVEEARKQVREGKAPGEDGIMPEVLKRINIDDIILSFSNKLLLDNETPEQFSTLNILPIPKSGDLSITSNYRGIALTSLVAKVINRMLLNRIRPVIDPKLRGNQHGFRPGRSTTTQVLALRRIIEGVKKKNLPAILTFIDFSKAFDSIGHKAMFEILKAYGVPPHILGAIKATYNTLRAKVVSPDGDTDYFNIQAGVMQGDTLAPFLFVIVLDYAMRKAIDGKEDELGLTLHERRSSRNPAISLCDLDFADDIVLLSNEIEQARKLLHQVENECSKVGLGLNAKKTMSMFINTGVELISTVGGCEVKQALTESGDQDFKYLGSWCDKSRDMQTRKALAWKALNKMDKIWKSELAKSLKLRYFRAAVETILLFGCATWTLTKAEEKSLDGTYTRMLRKVFNIDGHINITNKELYGGLSIISATIKRRRLQLAGHTYRDKTSPAHLTVTWDPHHGQASRGRPATSFVDSLLRDTGLATTAELETCMADRAQWREIIRSRCQPS